LLRSFCFGHVFVHSWLRRLGLIQLGFRLGVGLVKADLTRLGLRFSLCALTHRSCPKLFLRRCRSSSSCRTQRESRTQLRSDRYRGLQRFLMQSGAILAVPLLSLLLSCLRRVAKRAQLSMFTHLRLRQFGSLRKALARDFKAPMRAERRVLALLLLVLLVDRCCFGHRVRGVQAVSVFKRFV
jgi:hypothetical protein